MWNYWVGGLQIVSVLLCYNKSFAEIFLEITSPKIKCYRKKRKKESYSNKFLFFYNSRGEYVELLVFLRALQTNNAMPLADPHTQSKQNQASDLTQHSECWPGVALHPAYRWLILSLRPESNPWAQSRRSAFVPTYASHQRPASCVCATETTPLCPMACCIPPVSVCVWACMYVVDGGGHNRPSPAGCWIQVDRATFSCKNAPIHLVCRF